MANRKSYMPKSYTGVAITQSTNPLKSQDLTTLLWTNALLKGTAKFSGNIVSNAAVLVWTGAIGSMGNVYAITFTDQNGRYAVAVKTANKNLGIKIYS
ncbi:MAG: hypothetical protein ACRC3Y_05655 [Romboutsia sp.]|uniref:hypothetical protein n=1 Tax=Romboutsia sp. TaxID=1965302 RepID=UPI003F33AE6E